jgi:hypothetical protein
MEQGPFEEVNLMLRIDRKFLANILGVDGGDYEECRFLCGSSQCASVNSYCLGFS